MEVLGVVVGELVKSTIAPVGRQIGYLLSFRRILHKLDRKLLDLIDLRSDVQQLVELALNNHEMIRQVVEGWLERVEIVQTEVMRLNTEANEINSCFKGLCCSRYRLGKKAVSKIGTIQGLLDERSSFEGKVSDPKTNLSIEFMPMGDFEAFGSREHTTKQVMEALMDDNVSSIGVFGMGGVGKTVLMKALAKHVKKEKLFQEVVMLTVSQMPDLERIQADIAKELRIKFEEDEDTYSLRARRLSERLKQTKKVLIILDDMWERVELSDVGIPDRSDNRGCKVVLTTRDRDVCSLMETQVKVEVVVLLEQDSWNLFRQKAGDVVDSSSMQTIARDIVSECKGLPLAIVTIGRALRDKDELVWADALRQLKRSIYEGMTPVFSSIKLCYDFLRSKVTKLCFLFCCLFPEDYKISMDVMLSYVMGEKLLRDVDSLEEAKGRLHAILDKLTSSCLLTRDEDGYITMHDIIRDVAISVASEEENAFILKAGMGLEEWPQIELDNCKRLSLMSNKIKYLPDRTEAFELLTLSLNISKSILYIPPGFFEDMPSLSTLDLCHMSIHSLPPSLSCLVNLRTLRLENCTSLKDVSPIEKLKKLEILCLSNSGIRRLPQEIGELTNLKLLALSDARRVKSIAPKVISRLCRLEELYMVYSFSRWEIDGIDAKGSSLFEVASLTRLTSLDLHIESIDCFSIEISSYWEKLAKFEIILAPTMLSSFHENVYLKGTRKFQRSLCVKIPSTSVPNWVAFLLGRTNYLYLAECMELESIGQLDPRGFNNNLKSLFVSGCVKLKYLMNTSVEKAPRIALSNLEELYLQRMPDFEVICSGMLPKRFLQKLRVLQVLRCDKVISLLPADLLVKLQNIEVLEVKDCSMLMTLFHCQVEGLKGSHTILSTLREIHLENLPELIDIWKGVTPLVCLENLKLVKVKQCGLCSSYLMTWAMAKKLQRLEDLEIESCDMMVGVILSKEGDEQKHQMALQTSTSASTTATFPIVEDSNMSPFSSLPILPIFPNLRYLQVRDCYSLRYLFPISVGRGLVHLEELSIHDCSDMETIIAQDIPEDHEENDKAILPQLKSLNLISLPSLVTLSQQGLLLDLPSLEVLILENCENLKRLPFGPHSVPNLTKLYASYIWVEELEMEICLKSRLQALLLMDESDESVG